MAHVRAEATAVEIPPVITIAVVSNPVRIIATTAIATTTNAAVKTTQSTVTAARLSWRKFFKSDAKIIKNRPHFVGFATNWIEKSAQR